MKHNNHNHETVKSTYAMVVEFEQEQRRVYETAVYMLFMIAAVFSIWQVAHQPLKLPTTFATQSAPLVQAASVHHGGV
jgi:hypothetical protein